MFLKALEIVFKRWHYMVITVPDALRNIRNSYDIQTANGIKITGFAKHGLDRAIERGVKPNTILNAIKNPLKIGNVATDAVHIPRGLRDRMYANAYVLGNNF